MYTLLCFPLLVPGLGKVDVPGHLGVAPASQADSPPVVVEPGRFLSDEDAVESVPEFSPFQLLHDLEEDLVAILILEDIDHLMAGESFEGVIDIMVGPVDGDALEYDIAGELPNSIGDKLGQNPLRDGHTLIQLKQFIAKLDNIVAIAVNDQPVNIEHDIIDQLLPDLFHVLVILTFSPFNAAELADHVLDDAHSVFVQGEGQQVLDCVVVVVDGVFEGEGFDYLLDQVGCVVVTA